MKTTITMFKLFFGFIMFSIKNIHLSYIDVLFSCKLKRWQLTGKRTI